ncbi:MAG: FmdB family zinc ribbon protein [Limisphaerales bacterium]
MPTYEYICAKCGHEFEAIQSISAKPLAVCPKELCARKKWGRGRVKKKIGAGAGLIFKGTGFYITDHRSKNYSEAAKKDSAPAPAAAKTDSKGAPAKPAGKPAAPRAK